MPRLLPAIPDTAARPAVRTPPTPTQSTAARTLSEVRNVAGDWIPETPLSVVVPLGSECVDHLDEHYDWIALGQWVRRGSREENRAAAIPLISKACQANEDGLRALNLSSLRCTTLPPIPHGTEYLEPPRTLTCLSVPEGVTHVDARHCKALKAFAFPESLRWLNLSCVPMKALPSLPDGLEYLAAMDCGLETLPDTWPREIYVELGFNPVARADPSLSGKWITRSPGNALPGVVAAWFPPADRDGVEAAWAGFAGERGAEQFSRFLQKLRTSDLASGFGFVESRRPWLDRLRNDPSLRATMFAISQKYAASGKAIDELLKSMDVASWVADVEATADLVEKP